MLQWKPFKNDERCFLFYLKGSFRSKRRTLLYPFIWVWFPEINKLRNVITKNLTNTFMGKFFFRTHVG